MKKVFEATNLEIVFNDDVITTSNFEVSGDYKHVTSGNLGEDEDNKTN
jgi:hypothetical protein